MEAGLFLVGLFLISLVVAAIGHAIWLVYAAIWHAVFGNRTTADTSNEAVRQALLRFYNSGKIDGATLDRVVNALDGKTTIRWPIPPAQAPLPVQPLSSDLTPAVLQPTSAVLADEFVLLPIDEPAPPSSARQVPPPLPPAPPAAPAPARRPWSQVLASFMKEANIRWGELVGGLLVVGCSIALVRTFWSSIADQTWLKLGVFTAITTTVFAVGLYTEHRWKLPTTSRAILIIASLLVPLTFFAVLMRSAGGLNTLALCGTVVALGIFGWLLYAAGRVLTPDYPMPFALGILGASAAQIVISSLHCAGSLTLVLQALLPLGFYVAANFISAITARRRGVFDQSFADRLLALFGVTTFAVAPAIAHLIPAGDILAAFRALAPLFPIAAAPALAVGILLWNRLTQPELLNRRIAGTAIALSGVVLLLAAVAVAYPQRPASILCGIYALAALGIAYGTGRPLITWIGAGLLLAALLLWPEIDYMGHGGVIGLGFASFCMFVALSSGSWARAKAVFAHPLATAALLAATAALIHTFCRLSPGLALPSISRYQITAHLFWTTAIFLGASLIVIHASVFSLLQLLLSASAISAAWTIGKTDITSLSALRDAMLGISILSIVWSICRRWLAALPVKLKAPINAIDLDQCYPFLLLAGLGIIALDVVAPGLSAEFSTKIEFSAIAPTTTVVTWLIPLLIGISLLISQDHRPSVRTDLGLALTLVLTLPLAAAHFGPQAASASAWRWLSAGAMVGLSLPAWLNWRRPHRQLKPLLLFLTILPILAFTIHPASLNLFGYAPAGPATGAFFSRIGAAGNYLPPLLVAVAVLVAHALKDHSQKLALAAALVLDLSIALAYALHITTSGQAFAYHHCIRLLQFIFLATAGFAAVWLLILQYRRKPCPGDATFDSAASALTGDLPPMLSTLQPPVRAPAALGSTTTAGSTWPLAVQLAVAVIPMLMLLAAGEMQLLANPLWPSPNLRLLADFVGIPSILALAVVTLWAQRKLTGRISTLAITVLLLILGNLACFATSATSGWAAIHTLLAARIIAGWLILQIGWLLARSLAIPDIASATTPASGPLARLLGWNSVGHNITIAATVLGIWTVALGSFTQTADPSRPTWTLFAMVTAAALAVALAIWTLRGAFLAATGILLNLAASFWWQHHTSTIGALGHLYISALTLSLGGLIALGVEIFILRPLRGDIVRRTPFSWHAFACIFATLSLAAMTLFLFILRIPIFGVIPTATELVWLTFLATTLLALLCLYDEDAWCALPCLYVLGLAWIGQSYELLCPVIAVRFWHAIAALGAYSVLVAMIYNLRANLVQWLRSIGIPQRTNWPATSPSWLTGTTLSITLILTLLAIPYVLFDSSSMERKATATATICMAVAIGLLGAETGRIGLKKIALFVGAVAIILWSMAWVSPGLPDTLLNRLVISMVTAAALTALYAASSRQWLPPDSEWASATLALTPFLATATSLLLPVILAWEISDYQPVPPVPIMAVPAFAAVALTLLALSIGSFLCAFRPVLDPLRLPDRRRTGYIYAGQMLVAVLFIHARLVHPQWFGHGFFIRHWPVILLTIAFANAGISELLARRGQSVLAEPFTNIGALLPFAVVGGFAIVDSSGIAIDFSLLLLLIGAMYAGLAALRRSFVFSLLAVLAANGALWHTLATTHSFAFLQHPQLWLIPPALSVLAAAGFNRDRLTSQQMGTIRYICLVVIYLSSTADVWINRDDAAPWLPLILAALAASGVIAGIALRIQSFLFLGGSSTFIAVAAMIRIAARQVHSNWPWLVAGILLGAVIVFTFALFEKKRSEMLGMLEKLKEWDK